MTEIKKNSIILQDKGGVSHIILNQPDKHNALSPTMIEELSDAFENLSKDENTRVLILSANGKSFCAGGDLDWMKKQIFSNRSTRIKEAQKLAMLLFKMYSFPKPLIAKDLFEMGCYEISLGDTTGKGTPGQTLEVVKECLKYLSADKLAGHFHDTYQNALNNINVCLENGIKTFDASVGGLGGCPYSPGAKGNVATEKVNNLLLSKGYVTNLDRDKLKECSVIAQKLILN